MNIKVDGRSLCKAVKDFRQSLGDTQFEFAQRLGISFPTTQRYENVRPPKGNALKWLAYVAKVNGLTTFEQIFEDAQTNEFSVYLQNRLKNAAAAIKATDFTGPVAPPALRPHKCGHGNWCDECQERQPMPHQREYH